MISPKQSIIFGLLLMICVGNAFPELFNPNSEYELIHGVAQVVPPSSLVPVKPVTQKPIVINTPPPVAPDSKTFAYNSQSKTWTMVKKNDPLPAEDTLLWNQSNDKWLTQVARV